MFLNNIFGIIKTGNMYKYMNLIEIVLKLKRYEKIKIFYNNKGDFFEVKAFPIENIKGKIYIKRHVCKHFSIHASYK